MAHEQQLTQGNAAGYASRMTAKRGFTALVDANVVDDAARNRLSELGITTVEELVAELEAQPEGVVELLGLNEPQLERLRADSHAALPARTRQAMEELRDLDFPAYGAVDPDSE
jgi:hypothetical protein